VLYALGARNFLVPNMADLALAPFASALSPAERAGLHDLSLGYNAGLAGVLGSLALFPAINITPFDTFAFHNAVVSLVCSRWELPATRALSEAGAFVLSENSIALCSASLGIYLFDTKVLLDLLDNDGKDFGKNIIHIFDEFCPFLDQTIRSPRACLVDTARYGKDLSTLFKGDSCRNEGTALFGCLNNYNSQ